MIGAFGRRPGAWNLRRIYELFPLLTRLAKRPAAVLSGGEQQTLAIGRALMANPRLLLMDEISLGLAPIVVKGLYEAVPADRRGRDHARHRRAGREPSAADRRSRVLLPRRPDLVAGEGDRAEQGRDPRRLLRGLDDGVGERHRPRGPAGRALRVVRDRPVPHLRRDAGGEPGPRRPDVARGVRRARRHPTHQPQPAPHAARRHPVDVRARLRPATMADQPDVQRRRARSAARVVRDRRDRREHAPQGLLRRFAGARRGQRREHEHPHHAVGYRSGGSR